jgi:hypothetical protein
MAVKEVRMVPMVDTMVAPGTMGAIMIVGPGFVGVMVALIGGVAWIARQVAEERRRNAGRDRERTISTPPADDGRLAA